jgi:heptosyltransferase-2
MPESLVIAPQWIGDAVMTEPLMRRLHARGERLTVGALPWVAPVYRAMPHVADVIEFPFAHGGLQFRERRAIAKRIEGRFDKAYVLPNSLKSALLPFLASIPERIGYFGEARVGLLTHRLKNPKNKPPMVAFYSALSGGTDLDKDRPQLQMAPAEIDRALAALGLQRGGYHVFAPGAEYGPAKRWPARHFSELAARLDLPVVLLGSGKEAALCEEIAASGECGAARQVPELRGQDFAGAGAVPDRRQPKHHQQRLGPDACGRRFRCAAGGDFWLVQPAAYAAAERQGGGALAQGRCGLPAAAGLRALL